MRFVLWIPLDIPALGRRAVLHFRASWIVARGLQAPAKTTQIQTGGDLFSLGSDCDGGFAKCFAVHCTMKKSIE